MAWNVFTVANLHCDLKQAPLQLNASSRYDNLIAVSSSHICKFRLSWLQMARSQRQPIFAKLKARRFPHMCASLLCCEALRLSARSPVQVNLIILEKTYTSADSDSESVS